MAIFTIAKRKKAKLRLALCGPSGSGKTHSALLVAAGLSPEEKIFVIDTEHGSATLETGKPNIPEFFHAPLEPPFTPRRYIDYIHAAEAEGAEVIIIDSLSHAWAGSGGVLDMHDQATKAQRSANSWAAWREVTPEHNALVDAMLQSRSHIIATLRTKTAWEVVETDKGKKVPRKIGLKPEQREGLEYEFTVVFDLSVEGHVATASKDRTSLFDGLHFVPSAETGKMLLEWLETGLDPVQESQRLLSEFKAYVDTIEQPIHLTNWWKKHEPEFSLLRPEDRQELIDYCAGRKRLLRNQAA